MKRRRRRKRKHMKITQWFLSLSKGKKALLITGVVILCCSGRSSKKSNETVNQTEQGVTEKDDGLEQTETESDGKG